ncbi:ACT domain protein [uncultured archaeon]|nr:ACT domain protein [uncultured archaeon]
MANENGASLAEIVRQEISSTPYIKAALSDGVINYSALARRLMPVVQKRLGKKVNEESIVVSIKRYADELGGKEKAKNIMEYFAGSEVNLQDNICYAKFRKNDRTLSKIEKIFAEEDWNVGETRMMIESPDQIATILKETRFQEIKEELKDDTLYFTNHSSILTARMPLESFNDYGIIAEMSSLLAKNGISIHVISSPPDIHFIVSEDDAEKAHHTIRELILSAKKATGQKG